jgi:hypothetical protein
MEPKWAFIHIFGHMPESNREIFWFWEKKSKFDD